MPARDFKTELLVDEVVVAHVPEGHIFHLPILANGTVSLHGSRIEANPEAKREARRYLFEALDAAKAALVPH
jgi:hypothetical protein